jgi:hypothetical protein
MRFKDFLAEGTSFNFDKFFKDCAPFLSEIKGLSTHHLLKHASSNGPDDWGMKSHVVRTRPRDSKREVHYAVDAIFRQKFNWAARSDAIFVSSDYSMIKEFGVVYLIFPVGEFKYLWSEDVVDLVHNFDNVKNDLRHKQPGLSFEDRTDAAIEELIKQVGSTIDWKFNTDLKRAATSGNEVMLKSMDGKYYLIEVATDFSPEFLTTLKAEGYVT